MANLAVFGLGYVGTVTAACFAANGHKVVGVDANSNKLEMLRNGASPVCEPGLSELVAKAVEDGTLRVTADPSEAVAQSNLSFISVGTPSKHNGDVDLTALRKVLGEIGLGLRSRKGFHTVVLRSTVLPGTTSSFALPIITAYSQKTFARDFDLFFNPEFLREGSAIQDFNSPPYVIIGRVKEQGNEFLKELWSSLPIRAPLIELPAEEAEMLKYASNAFHALKVAFANELGSICKALGIDSQKVMNVFAQDRGLNISGRYLMPGFAYGGSCLPKDLDALNYLAKNLDTRVPILENIARSNEIQVMHAATMVLKTGKRKVAIMGLGFKAGTDDVRNSPAVLLTEHLMGKGLEVKIYDRFVYPELLTGRNRLFLETALPHIVCLLRHSAPECIEASEVVVICTHDAEVEETLVKTNGKVIVDLVGEKELKGKKEDYIGIAW